MRPFLVRAVKYNVQDGHAQHLSPQVLARHITEPYTSSTHRGVSWQPTQGEEGQIYVPTKIAPNNQLKGPPEFFIMQLDIIMVRSIRIPSKFLDDHDLSQHTFSHRIIVYTTFKKDSSENMISRVS